MLSPEKRQQLDGIVLKMSENNESPADVQFVVDDFKKKYENQVVTPAQIKTQEQEKGFLEKAFSSEGKDPYANLNVGLVKGALNTIDSLANIGQDIFEPVANKIVGGITGKEIKDKPNAALPSYVTEADGTSQSIGKGIEQVGEFFIPTTLTAKLAKIGDVGIMGTKLATEFGKSGELLAKTLSLATRSGLLAGEAAGVSSIQTYGDEDATEQAKMNALFAGAIPIVGKVVEKGVKPVMTVLGKKIQTSVIKPSVRDIKDGFNINNVGKYDVGGSLEQMSSKVHNAIEQRSKQLQSLIQETDARFDLGKAITEVEVELATSGTKTFGFNSRLGKAIQVFREEAAMIAEDGIISIPEAQQIKRSIGKIGAWEYGKRDPDSSALEAVANKLYTKVKEGIESISPESIRGINKEISELIPIENAIVRRMPVADRQNALSLSDVITVSASLAHPGNWWLFVLNKMARSSVVGNALEKGGRKLKEGRGALKTLLFGAEEGASLTPGEAGAAKTISTAIDSVGSKGGLSIQDVSRFPQKKSELTTKLLKDIDGKAFVSKQYLLDATNRPELKQVEKELIRDLLETEGDKIDVTLFTQKVEAELLPLKIRNNSEELFKTRGHDNIHTKALSRPKYEGVTLPSELRGEVKDYAEHIYESPIKTSSSVVHFNGETENYFGHTRVEDMAPEYKVGNTTYRSKSEAKIFGDKPVEQPKVRRVIEVQSDLYQKGRLENEINASKLATAKSKDIQKYKETGLSEDEAILRAEADMRKGVKKLEQYNNPTAHFRMVREEIKRAADDGVEKLQFPTGETGMKIEGLGQGRLSFASSSTGMKLSPDDLKVGSEVYRGHADPTGEVSLNANDDWVITEVLGDGKFKAVQKHLVEKKKIQGVKNGEVVAEAMYSPKKLQEYKNDGLETNIDDFSESFDISGKVDTNNPIYKFYEKELGKYLKNKYNAELVTDKQGVNWMEVNIKPEHKGPVEAFGKARLDTVLAGAAGTGALTAGVAGVKTLQDKSLDGKTFENKKLGTTTLSGKNLPLASNKGEDEVNINTDVISKKEAINTIFSEAGNSKEEYSAMYQSMVNRAARLSKQTGKEYTVADVLKIPRQYQGREDNKLYQRASKEELNVIEKKKIKDIEKALSKKIDIGKHDSFGDESTIKRFAPKAYKSGNYKKIGSHYFFTMETGLRS